MYYKEGPGGGSLQHNNESDKLEVYVVRGDYNSKKSAFIYAGLFPITRLPGPLPSATDTWNLQ
jgi:hypothetical protein